MSSKKTINNGTSEAGAFQLLRRTTAGAYEYLLFRGSSTKPDDWFLRSHLIYVAPPIDPPIDPPVVPPIDPPVVPPIDPPVVPPIDPPVVPPEEPVETSIYRPEVPLYTPIPAFSRQMGLAYLGTLHERAGEQMNIAKRLDQSHFANGAWGRLIGEAGNASWSGTVNARARDNQLMGIQAGLDLYRAEHSNGHRDHFGIYGGYARQTARIEGFALGIDGLPVGELTVQGPAVGAYWTHFGPAGTYIDGVAQFNWFNATGISDYGTQLETSGTGFTASLEAGHPFRLGESWVIEPQAQLIYQTTSVKAGRDAFSSVSFDADDAVTGRLGLRLQYSSTDGEKVWQPYAKANIWHGFSGTDTMSIEGTALASHFGGTSLELGAGFTAKLNQTTSVYGHVDHRWSLGGDERRSVTQAALGLRLNW